MRMRSQIIYTQIDMLKKEHSQALTEKNFQKARQIMKKIEHLTIEYNKARGEELIQAAIDNGAMARFNLLISAAQILNSVTNSLITEASDLLTDNGLLTDGIADENRLYIKAADRYFKEFGKLVQTDEKAMDMFKDIEWFEDWFRMWAKLKERPKEQRLRGCKKAAHKADGLSTMCKKCRIQPDPDSIMCRACSRSFVEGFQKGAKWLDNKLNPKEEKKEEGNK